MSSPARIGPSMRLDTQPGERVRYEFTMNGWDSDKETAQRYLSPGCEYTVKHMYVGNWTSYVELVERPGIHFNTSQFENVSNSESQDEPSDSERQG